MRGVRGILAGRGLFVLACIALLATVPQAYAARTRPHRTATRLDAGPANPPFSSVATHRKIVALTFDDGPDPFITPKVLAMLARHHARATFFDTGMRAAARPDLVLDELRIGEIGNHSFDHPHLAGLSLAAATWQIAEGQAVLGGITGDEPHWFRPPYGDVSPATGYAARAFGLPVVLWDVAVDRRHTPAAIDRAVHPGAIILAHDACPPRDSPEWCARTRLRSLAALDQALSALESRGFRVVTVSELLRG